MTPPSPQQQGMHPHDKRNLAIFVVLSLGLWLAFDHFILTPRYEAAHKAQEAKMEQGPQSPQTSVADPILPRTEQLAKSVRIPLSSKELEGSIALTGNRLDDIVLKDYYTALDKKDHVVLMSPSGTTHPHYAESGWLASDPSIKLPDADTLWSVTSTTAALTPATPLVLTWDNGAGLVFERSYAIDDQYVFTLTQKVTNSSGKTVTLYPYTSLARRGLPEAHGKGSGYEGPVGYIADKLHEISYNDLTEDGAQKFTALSGWIGFGEKYWLSALLPAQTHQNNFSFQAVVDPNDPSKTLYQVDQRGEQQVIENGKNAEDSVHIFVGAKEITLLNDYEEKLGVKHFDLAIDFGWLYFLTKPLYYVLTLFYGWVGNFGVAILMLTIGVRSLVFPLASKSYRSFAGLRKIGPKMAEIKARYADDKPRFQQELIKLYEAEKVNPMAGCFPILLQMPIFFAVYKVISISVEMRHAPFFGWIHDLSERDPLTVFNLFGLVPFDPPSFLHIGPWSILMLVLMLIQKQFNPPPTDQIQKDVANFMPWVMTYTLATFPSALVIYWAFSNLFSVVQQAYIMWSMNVPIYLFAPDKAVEHAESFRTETAKTMAKVSKEMKEEAKAKTDAKTEDTSGSGKDETKDGAPS